MAAKPINRINLYLQFVFTVLIPGGRNRDYLCHRFNLMKYGKIAGR